MENLRSCMVAYIPYDRNIHMIYDTLYSLFLMLRSTVYTVIRLIQSSKSIHLTGLRFVDTASTHLRELLFFIVLSTGLFPPLT